MSDDLDLLLAAQGGVAGTAQLLRCLGRAGFEAGVAHGVFAPVWTGVYTRGDPADRDIRLAGLDLRAGCPVAICLSTAAAAYGFDTETIDDLHVLTPEHHQLRDSTGLIVHRRDGAPLGSVDGRPATAPAWTAIEVARGLRRPRALATLDAALRSGTCDRGQLWSAAGAQAGRRGVVTVRELIPLAAAESESPMESEARLAMHDGGLPDPVLQYEILDLDYRLWRVDFAWPAAMLAVEYDGFDCHSDPAALAHDRQKREALAEMGWRVVAIVSDDVRRRQVTMIRRIAGELTRRQAARACADLP